MHPSESLWQAGAGPQGVSSATFYNRFRGYLAKAGLPPSGVHVLRHTAAKLRRDVGESVESVSQFLDHSSLAVTTTYLRRLEGERDAAWHGVATVIGVELAPTVAAGVSPSRLTGLNLSRWGGSAFSLQVACLPPRLDLSRAFGAFIHPAPLPIPLEVVLPGSARSHIVSIATISRSARVSSDEQRDRHTVRNQRAALSRRLGSEPGVVVFKHYEDDGVSGTIPLEDRPAGRALVRDARVGRFSQIWVVRADRLGRDAFELLRIWRVFESIGISLRATDENIDDPFYFDIHAVIAANERRKFLERSAEGMNRAAREGRYTGGIVPLGYTVSGDRGFRRLVPDDSPMWADLSAADVVRRIYHHLAVGRLDLSAYRQRVQLARHPHLLSPRRSRRQRPSHPGPLALRSYPQPRRQSRLQGASSSTVAGLPSPTVVRSSPLPFPR